GTAKTSSPQANAEAEPRILPPQEHSGSNNFLADKNITRYTHSLTDRQKLLVFSVPKQAAHLIFQIVARILDLIRVVNHVRRHKNDELVAVLRIGTRSEQSPHNREPVQSRNAGSGITRGFQNDTANR